ncbi:MAG: hypothetical protein ACREN2_06090 [Candidatus Dormibacteria bacterium]
MVSTRGVELRTEPHLDQAVPQLASVELLDLKRSIADHGFLPACEIAVTSDGVLLDGRARLQVCRELGIEAPRKVVDVPPEERWDYVVLVNLRRRHLTIEQRRDITREYLRRHPELSNTAVSRATGLSTPTVGAVRRQMGERSPFRPQGGPKPRVAVGDGADHRRQCWFELTLGYVSDDRRLRWEADRIYLTTPAPTTDAEVPDLLHEMLRTVQRLLRERPLRTMRSR